MKPIQRRNRPSLSLEEVTRRFWTRVQKSDGCWEWTAASDPHGYGRMRYDGKVWLSHRFSYERAFGPIPEGAMVCHRCDNPACVRPDHLFLGTQSDNMRDCVDKGRVRGQFAPTRYTPDDVRRIRTLYEAGTGCRQLARMFSDSNSRMWRIATRREWKSIE